MARVVTIFGGSGFVGRYIARRMARAGWRVRVAVRRPNEAMFVKPYGTVGQVEPVFCNIRDDDSVRAVTRGADAVVNCVGTFALTGKNDMEAVNRDGAARIARVAAEEGVGQLVHISAIGADAEGESVYARTKGQGEAAVREAFPGAVVLRPSLVFGPEDAFFNRFAGMARMSPVVPLFGAETKFQPVYVDDLAAAAVKGAEGEAAAGVYELGGPDVASFRELVEEMLEVIRRRRLVVGLPFWAGRVVGVMSAAVNFLSGGLIAGPMTSDQLVQLKTDTVVRVGAKGFAELGIVPTSMEAILPSYLWQFRPDGQYSDITRSARNLRG